METSTRKTGAVMKKFFVAAVALAAWVSTGLGGIAVNWTAGGKVYGHDAGSGIATETTAIWQLVYAGEDEMANEVAVSEDGWVSGDDVVLATRVIPAGGGMAEDGTEWDGCLAKVEGNSVFVDMGWTGTGKYVFQRVYQGSPQVGTPYFESGLFPINSGYVGGVAFPDMFGAAAGAESSVVHANRNVQPELPRLSLTESERTFPAYATSGNALGVKGNVEWTAVASVTWLTLKTENGSGNGTIAYNVAANTVTNSRTGTITVTGGGLTGTFTVTQNGAAPMLMLGADGQNFTAEGANGQALEVTANVTWTAVSSSAWLTVETDNGSGNGTIMYNVAANMETNSRTGIITVTGGGLERVFTVVQDGVLPMLTLGEDSRSFTAAAASGQTLAVEANVSWTAQSSSWWLMLNAGRGSGNGTITYDVVANAGTNSRTGTITVEGEGVIRRFTVTQNGTAVTVENVTAKQRFPWNGLVDINCTVKGLVKGEVWEFAVATEDVDSGDISQISHFWVVWDGTNSNDRVIRANGDYHLVWDAQAELGAIICSNMVVCVTTRERHGPVQLWERGPYWAEYNLGAEEPWDYGLYFWWGDTVGYRREGSAWVANDGSVQNFSFNEENTPTYGKNKATLLSEGWITEDGMLAPEHDAAQVHWGEGWRMPTDSELSALVNNCDWTWTAMNGVNGYVVRGRGDFAEASIFLPAAGYGYGASLRTAGSYGLVWSSVPYADYSGNAWGLNFDSGYYGEGYVGYYDRDDGFSVRPVRGFAE